MGKPALLIPLPLAGSRGDQIRNARVVEEAGAAVVMPEESTDPEGFARTLLEILGDQQARDRMAGKMRALARPDSAERIAGILAQYLETDP
jgi:UDP-N-acetylglucosamine--N-acetylmuramyl-(pentapeptide) pyrophosphoryl-undecaprenol N-acetylglucosamine transferase